VNTPASLTPAARRALAEAARWIADDNPAAARRLREAVAKAGRLIGARPLAGRVQPDLVGDQYRFWSLPGFPFVLVYRPATLPPQIVRVIHTSRDLPAALTDLRD
jgi:toxin ParE1/3/4